ncbi:MAG: BrnT family toxin [Puniceicoccales bacterium]
MRFEFDPKKSHANRDKHGIDFLTAKELWNDPDAINIDARSDDEPRFALIAKIQNKHWVAFYTIRADNIRLISVRRARKKEKEFYES